MKNILLSDFGGCTVHYRQTRSTFRGKQHFQATKDTRKIKNA